MFTGIVEEVGRIVRAEPRDGGRALWIAAPGIAASLAPGASLAVAGVCQTVLETDARESVVSAAAETLRVTTLGGLAAGAAVNLERALPAQGRFDGHVVLGHVDGTATVVERVESHGMLVLGLEVPPALAPYVVPKGSIALDGVSLTIGPVVESGRFEVFLIPYTREHTSLGNVGAGDRVNVETDILIRALAHLLQSGAIAGITAPAAQAALAHARLGGREAAS